MKSDLSRSEKFLVAIGTIIGVVSLLTMGVREQITHAKLRQAMEKRERSAEAWNKYLDEHKKGSDPDTAPKR